MPRNVLSFRSVIAEKRVDIIIRKKTRKNMKIKGSEEDVLSIAE